MKTKVLLLTFAIATLLTACNNKDGAISRHKKISEIYSSSQVLNDGTPYYTIDRHLVQHWLWDKNELYRIEYIEDFSVYSENIFYDRRHRISRTTVPAYGLKSEFAYTGRKLDSIQVYQNDILSYTLHFTHENHHISSILQHFANPSVAAKQLKFNPLHLMLDDNLFEQTNQIASQAIKKAQTTGRKGALDITYTLTWEKDNLAILKSSFNNGSSEIAFTYDNKTNPFKECYTFYEIQDAEPGTVALSDNLLNFLVVSKNNILSVTRPFAGNDNYTFNYTYTYEGNYPSVRQSSYSYPSLDSQTAQPNVVTVKETREYIYLD